MKLKKTICYFSLLIFLTSIIFSCQDKIETTGIRLDKTELVLSTWGTATLTAVLVPHSSSDKMKWTTSNGDVAIVENNYAEGAVSKAIVTAKSSGTTEITVSTKDGKHSATCIVFVVSPEPELIFVEGGTFTMGCTDGECDEESIELPIHQVTLSSFKIAKYPVTQLQWEAVMGNNSSYSKGHDLPVEYVSWNSIQEFIKKLNENTGKNYRLPTEAEWEYAARGGNKSKGYKYSGSDDINAVAWYSGNSNRTTHPVGEKMPNELGIYDMSGNVLELCSDWYSIYDADPQTNPTGPARGFTHIMRGGDFYNNAQCCRVSFRKSIPPANYGANVGFRLVHP